MKSNHFSQGQLVTLTNITPEVRAAFIQIGLNDDAISQLTDPNVNVIDDYQHLAYLGMKNITGTSLEQILAVFGVTTPYIMTMADLLNPVKIFPKSYNSLTVRTYNQDTTSVLRAIYDNNQGTVNSKLLLYLPKFVLTQGNLTTISYQRLARIVPSDQALASKAIQVSLQQIKNVGSLTLPQLAAAFSNMETTRDLPAISALQQAVPASVAAFYSADYATGTGPNGTLVLTDLLGAAVGVPYTKDLTNVTTMINSMTTSGILGTLTLTYGRMTATVNGDYNVGNTVEIPPGPGEGTYSNVDSALNALISNAASEVSSIQSSYPTQSGNLNANFTDMAASLKREQTNLSLATINIATLPTTGRGPIMSFVQNLPSYGVNTEENGPSQFLETVANLNTQGGQSIVACLREGRNAAFLNAVNIGVDSAIPSTSSTIPPQANLIPSTYSDAEAAKLVVK
jgi:anti-anti-sigma regulatory factor